MKKEEISLLKLNLDLNNVRRLPQRDCESVLREIVESGRERFVFLLEHLWRNGYLPVESLVVVTDKRGGHTVLDGNRRVAALQYAHGLLGGADLRLPVRNTSAEWKRSTASLPCLVFPESEHDEALALAAKIHGSARGSTRVPWKPLDRVRVERDMGAGRPVLRMLESFMKGRAVPSGTRALLSPDYDYEILDEAVSRVAKALGTTRVALGEGYPRHHGVALEALMRRVGSDPTFTLSYMRAGVDEWIAACGFVKSPGASQASVAPPRAPVRVARRSVPPGSPGYVKFLLEDTGAGVLRAGRAEALRLELLKLDHEISPTGWCLLFGTLVDVATREYCVIKKWRHHAGETGTETTTLHCVRKTIEEAEKFTDMRRPMADAREVLLGDGLLSVGFPLRSHAAPDAKSVPPQLAKLMPYLRFVFGEYDAPPANRAPAIFPGAGAAQKR